MSYRTWTTPIVAWVVVAIALIAAAAFEARPAMEWLAWVLAALTLFVPAYLVCFAALAGSKPRRRITGAVLLPLALYAASWLIPWGSGSDPLFAGRWPLGLEALLKTGEVEYFAARTVAGLLGKIGRRLSHGVGKVSREEPAVPPVREGGECVPTPCARYCQFGFARDERGCTVCACQNAPLRRPDVACPVPSCELVCDGGFVVDAWGCTTCECVR